MLGSAKNLVWTVAQWIAIEIVGRALYYSGVLFFIGVMRRRIGRPRLIVPMYHRVRDGGSADSALLEIERGVDAVRFEAHLRVFSWFGSLVTLREGVSRLRVRVRERSAVAITFDDGYRDVLEHAAPALKRCDAVATIFPVIRTTDGGRALWWDEVAAYARSSTCGRVGPQFAARAIHDTLLPLARGQREAVLDQLWKHQGVAPASAPEYLDWRQLDDLAAAGFEIGGHTLDHPVLPAESPAEIVRQVGDCRSVIEKRLARPVHSFAYPNGDCSHAVCAAVAQAGFQCAVTTKRGVNYSATEPYRLFRMPIGNERPFHLALKLAFYGWLPQRPLASSGGAASRNAESWNGREAGGRAMRNTPETIDGTAEPPTQDDTQTRSKPAASGQRGTHAH